MPCRRSNGCRGGRSGLRRRGRLDGLRHLRECFYHFSAAAVRPVLFPLTSLGRPVAFPLGPPPRRKTHPPGVGLGAEAPGIVRSVGRDCGGGPGGRLPPPTEAFQSYFGGSNATCAVPAQLLGSALSCARLDRRREENASSGGPPLAQPKSRQRLAPCLQAPHPTPQRPPPGHARLALSPSLPPPYATAPPALSARLALPSLLVIERQLL